MKLWDENNMKLIENSVHACAVQRSGNGRYHTGNQMATLVIAKHVGSPRLRKTFDGFPSGGEPLSKHAQE
jgi:hypothetical protein